MDGYIFIPTVLAITCVLGAPSYNVIFEKVELIDHNKEIVTNIIYNVRMIDRIRFKVNSTFTLLKPVNMDNARGSAQVFIYNNNNYVMQPLKTTKRVCAEYRRQVFVDFMNMEKYGNLSGCGTYKPGYYSLLDYPPKLNLPDLPIRRGKYKVRIGFYQGKTFIANVDFYGRIEDAAN